MLVAVYGLVVDVIQVLFGAHAGDYVDRTARLSAVRSTLVAENICIALCVASLIIILAQGRESWLIIVSLGYVINHVYLGYVCA
jgi:hypothetical protein